MSAVIPTVSDGAGDPLLLSLGNPAGHLCLVGPTPWTEYPQTAGHPGSKTPHPDTRPERYSGDRSQSPAYQGHVALQGLAGGHIHGGGGETGEERAETMRHVAKPCSPLMEMQGTGLVHSTVPTLAEVLMDPRPSASLSSPWGPIPLGWQMDGPPDCVFMLWDPCIDAEEGKVRLGSWYVGQRNSLGWAGWEADGAALALGLPLLPDTHPGSGFCQRAHCFPRL